ncbi:MAG: amino acid adenylation domain-containing protein, partial [bacterium]|nr:amino acid adenylation domain-containing protein [bacterium]
MTKSDKRNIGDILSLTPIQEGLLFHYLKNPDSDHYLEQFSLEISGDVRPVPFEKAWNFVIRVNQMLRTVFRWEKLDHPVQVVLKEYTLETTFHDLSGLEAPQRKTRLKEIKVENKTGDVDLRTVFFKVTLCRLEESRYLMIVTNHHILYDGWSNGIILKEFLTAYNAFLYNNSPQEPVKAKFNDYIKWIGSRDKEKQATYWTQYLKGFEPGSELSIKTWKSGHQSQRTGKYRVSLFQDSKSKLEAFARTYGVTLAALFYSAWGVLLQKYNNTGDVVFGTTVSGRSAKVDGIEELVGLFINTLPLRVQNQGDETRVGDLLQDIDRTLRVREEYESTPLTDIKEYSPLGGEEEMFDTLLAVENYPLDSRLSEMAGGLSLQSYSMEERTHYDLSAGIMMFEDISVDMLYNQDCFDSKAIEQLGRHFWGMVSQIMETPDRLIDKLGMLSIEEKRRILEEFNTYGSDYSDDKSLLMLFEKQVENIPHNIACVERENHLSFDHLNARAEELAASELNDQNRLIGIMMNQSIDLLIGILSILKSGNTFVPISAKFPDQRIRFILRDCNINILFTDSFNLEKAQLISKDSSCPDTVHCIRPLSGNKNSNTSVNTGKKTVSFNPRSTPATPAAFDQPCYVIYTSGSTGQPKGVPITHQNLSPLMIWSRDYFKLGPHIRVLQNLSYIFDFGIFELMTTIIFGGRLYFPTPELMTDPLEYVRFIDAHQVNTFHTTPSFFSHILHSSPGSRMPSIRTLHFGGEPLTPGLVAESSRRLSKHCTLYNGYGPTENTINSSIYSIKVEKETPGETFKGISSNPAGDSLPIGSPSANNIIYILDRHGHLLPPGAAGELYIGGSGVACGYINRPELSADKFIINPFHKGERFYRTGDRGLWLEDGNIQFLGRIDFQVKIRGFRIEPGEIENHLSNHKRINEAVVMARQSSGGEKYLCAYIVPVPGNTKNTNPEEELSGQRLSGYLSGKLPDYMIPSYFVIIDRMPLTPNGKVDRKNLPEPDMVSENQYAPPRNETEKALVEIWSSILEIEPAAIGIDTHFFRLGGHSLKAVSHINRVYKIFDVQMPLTIFFQSPTIRSVARFIHRSKEEHVTDEHYQSIPLAEEKEYYPLTNSQKRFFLHQQVETTDISYNMQELMMLEGPLEKEQFESVIKQIIHRHESLRTGFRLLEGEPVQIISPDVHFELAFHDLTGLAGTSQTSEKERITRRFIKPFDLGQAPLLAAGLVKTGAGIHWLMINIHHIIADGVSVGIFIKEFLTLYTHRQLQPLKLRYRDYVQWRNRSLKKKKYQNHPGPGESEPARKILELPCDFPRSPHLTFEGRMIKLAFEEHRSQALKSLARRLDAGLFILLLGAFNVFLSKISGQEYIVVGSPMAGRVHDDLQDLMGLFINTLVLGNSPSGQKPFTAFLTEVKTNAVNAFEHQDIQYDRLTEAITAAGRTGRNPLFDVMFALQNLD